MKPKKSKEKLFSNPGNQEIHIGGIDNPVIKHPLTNEPYIPGSSLKGKMRTLLEYKLGKVDRDGRPWSPPNGNGIENDPICRIFGSGNPRYSAGPTRLIVRDGYLTGAYKLRIDDPKDDLNVYDILEGKWENSIDRKRGPRGIHVKLREWCLVLNLH